MLHDLSVLQSASILYKSGSESTTAKPDKKDYEESQMVLTVLSANDAKNRQCTHRILFENKGGNKLSHCTIKQTLSEREKMMVDKILAGTQSSNARRHISP